jgi:hypothetical protein
MKAPFLQLFNQTKGEEVKATLDWVRGDWARSLKYMMVRCKRKLDSWGWF